MFRDDMHWIRHFSQSLGSTGQLLFRTVKDIKWRLRLQLEIYFCGRGSSAHAFMIVHLRGISRESRSQAVMTTTTT